MIIKLKKLIKELIVKDLSKGNPEYIISWKDKLFLFNKDSDLLPIYQHLLKHPSFSKNTSGYDDYIKNKDKEDFAYELVSYVGSDMPPDIIGGIWYPEKKQLQIIGMEKASPSTSIVLKKIVNALKVKSIIRHTDEDEEEITPKKKIKSLIPKVVWHGTASDYLPSILKFGLEAGRGPSQFSHKGITHEKEVFFSSNFNNAKFYADNATYEHRYPPKKRPEVVPVILEIFIPDSNLIVPDYDADATSIHKQLQYYHHEKEQEKGIMKPMGMSKEVGKFGYSGRIPSFFIRWIYFQDPLSKKWRKFKPSTVHKEEYKYGIGNWLYKMGFIL